MGVAPAEPALMWPVLLLCRAPQHAPQALMLLSQKVLLRSRLTAMMLKRMPKEEGKCRLGLFFAATTGAACWASSNGAGRLPVSQSAVCSMNRQHP